MRSTIRQAPQNVVLRFEEGGGFVMPDFLATQAPSFTLYGDGTIVFRNQLVDPLEPVGSVFVAPTDFVSNSDPNAFQLPARVMSPAEVEVLGIEPFSGGFQGLNLFGPDDGKVYSFSLRPLLPDETA